MNKKKLIFIIIGLVIIALLVGIYFAWKSKTNNNPTISNQNPTAQFSVQSQSTTTDKLHILSKNPAMGYWVAYSSSTTPNPNIYYIYDNGQNYHNAQIFEIASGTENLIASSTLIGLGNIKISNDGKMILLKSGTGENDFDVYNSDKNMWQQSFDQLGDMDISPDGKSIIYSSDSGIFKTGLDKFTSAITKLSGLSPIDFNLNWINTDNVILSSKPSSDIDSEIWNLNLKNKTLSEIASGKGLMVNWSKFGDLGIKFSVDNGNNRLTLIDGSGNKKADFNFFTFPDKCLISSLSQIYCAIPKDQSVFSDPEILDNYLKHGIYFNDGIYQIDLQNNKFQPLYDSDNNIIDAVDLTLSGNELFFINRYDNKLYSLDL